MRLKKSVFGYINFTIGTVIMSVYLYTLFVSLLRIFEENAGRRVYFYGIGLPYLISGVIVIALAGLYFLLSLIKSKIAVRNTSDGAIISTVIYWFMFALLLSYGVFVRINNLKVIKEWGTIKNYTDTTAGAGYWKNLLNLFFGNEVSFDNFFHKLYLYIAALLLRIFGDTLTVPAVLNIILYVIASVMMFMSVKYIFGKLPSLVVFAVLMISRATVGLMYEIAGFNLFFLTVSLIVFLVTYFLDVYTKTKPVMCYIVAGIALVAVVLLNHFAFKPFAIKSIYDVDIFCVTPENISFVALVCVTVIAAFALFAYLSHLKSESDEISFANILFVVFMVIHLFDGSSNNTFWFVIISLCVLAGIGADNLLFKNYKKAESVTDNIDEYFVTTPVTEFVKPEEPVMVDVEKPEPAFAKAPSETTPEPPAVHESEEDKQAEKAEEKPIENTEEKPKVPQFFETPLPMPKKHVKKSIDYAFEPSDDLMKYDVEISPNDDFDIK